jgi:uncharacterized repeat protein (TIGR02543 family)
LYTGPFTLTLPGTVKAIARHSWFNDSPIMTAAYTAGAGYTGGAGYTVTFDPNGGSWSGMATSQTVTVDEGTSVNMPEPTKTDLHFYGWSETAGGAAVAQPYTPTGDITLYARWAHLVTFDANGGNWSGSTTQLVYVIEGSQLNTQPDPRPVHDTNASFTVVGWTPPAVGAQAPSEVTFPYYPTANVTLTAAWAHRVADASDWADAINAANSASSLYPIYIGANSFSVLASGGSNNPALANYAQIGITGSGTIRLETGAQGNLLNIPDYASVTLNGPTLEGHSTNNSSLVRVSGGAFTLQNGTIKNNHSNAYLSGGVDVLSGGSFIMHNGSITNNTSGSATVAGTGGGVAVAGSFTMNGGSITNNTTGDSWTPTPGYGGGVHITSGSFTMNGGSIAGNTAYDGGGVFVGGAFIMDGGSITNNTANNTGGGVYVYGNFTLDTPASTASVDGNSSNNVAVGLYNGIIDGTAGATAGW